jgi:hypothetical protein
LSTAVFRRGEPTCVRACRGASTKFQDWKDDGLLAGYHVLFSRFVDNNNWDMIVILNFRGCEQVAESKEMESRSPAGRRQARRRRRISPPVHPVDLARAEEPDTPPTRPVYLVVPYSFAVPPAGYIQYFDDYVRPQLDGWRREGVLVGYGLYLQCYTAARPWDTMLALEYKDDAVLGLREKIVGDR